LLIFFTKSHQKKSPALPGFLLPKIWLPYRLQFQGGSVIIKTSRESERLLSIASLGPVVKA
jgi:hypothetical protein